MIAFNRNVAIPGAGTPDRISIRAELEIAQALVVGSLGRFARLPGARHA